MRVAHVITRLILGGAQENTVLTCEDLVRIHGDEVLLVTGPPLGPEGSLMDRVRAGGVPVLEIDSLRRAIHPWRDAISYRAIRRAIKSFQPDVVHTHSAKAGILGRAAAHRLSVPAIVHGVHGAPFHPYQGRGVRAFYRACERWAAGKCDAFISVADAMTDLMVESGVAPREKFTTIYSGMEVEPFLAASQHRAASRRRLGYSDRDVVVGKVARLFHLKGHEYVIQAAKKAVAACPQLRFLFVGDGILRGELTTAIAAAGLNEYFQFTGLVPPEQIPELVAAMDIVVHASLREGLARVLPQALIAGRPVISYDVDGAREVVLPGMTGCLLPPKSVEPLAEAIVRLARDPLLRDQMGEEGSRRFTNLFHHRRMTEQTRALYQKILAAKQGRGGQGTRDGDRAAPP